MNATKQIIVHHHTLMHIQPVWSFKLSAQGQEYGTTERYPTYAEADAAANNMAVRLGLEVEGGAA